MGLAITDLFTPAPSGVQANNPATAPPAGSWYAILLQNGNTLGLPTTSWQPGGVTRTQLAMLATALAGSDQVVSTMNQGGFLDWAAAVTPDPAVLGTAATPGWLDKLADSNFNCQRLGGVLDPNANTYLFARGNIALTNAVGASYGPFAPGTYHVGNPATGKTYNNVNLLTIAPNAVTTAAFVADQAGAQSTSAPGTITQPVTSLTGVTCTNAASLVGNNPESNAALVLRCRLKQQSLSPNGPKGAHQFFALTSAQILANLSPPVTLRNGAITRALSQFSPLTGTLTLTIANASAATDGVAGLQVTGCTGNAVSPIVLTVPATTGLQAGDAINVQGVQGNTAANGYHTAAALTGTTITLEAASVGNGSYTTGGTVEGGDLGLVDYIIQSNCVPLTETEVTQWATPQNVTVAMTVWVPAAQATAVVAAISGAMASYFANVPIGGFLTGVPAPNTIPVAGAEAACAIAAPYIQDMTLTFNGTGADVSLGATSVPLLVWSGGSPNLAITVNTF